MNVEQVLSFLNTDLPSKVPASERQPLVSDFNKVPIVTESITVADGFYLMEPTLRELLALKNKLLENDPNMDESSAYNLVLQFVMRNMTNIDFENGNTTLGLLGEVEKFIVDRFQNGFFYLEILSNTQSKKQKTDMTGTIEEPA